MCVHRQKNVYSHCFPANKKKEDLEKKGTVCNGTIYTSLCGEHFVCKEGLSCSSWVGMKQQKSSLLHAKKFWLLTIYWVLDYQIMRIQKTFWLLERRAARQSRDVCLDRSNPSVVLAMARTCAACLQTPSLEQPCNGQWGPTVDAFHREGPEEQKHLKQPWNNRR